MWPVGLSLRWPLSLQSMGSSCVGSSSCGPRAQLLRGTWDPPRPGIEPVSPALAGGFLTTAPPGKPIFLSFLKYLFIYLAASGLICDMRDLSLCARAWLPHGMWDLSSPTRDRTHVPCIGRWILNHWTTRGVPSIYFLTL